MVDEAIIADTPVNLGKGIVKTGKRRLRLAA